MKKTLLALMVILLITLAINIQVIAQQGINNLVMATAIGDNTNAAGAVVKDDAVNKRALKHFEKSFKNISKVTWMQLKDGFLARFDDNNIMERVFYQTNGNLAGTLKGYSGDILPKEIKSIIKNNYAGFPITYVDEAEITTVAGTPVYIVHLQNGDGIKLIRVFDGETEEIFDSEKVLAKKPKRF